MKAIHQLFLWNSIIFCIAISSCNKDVNDAVPEEIDYFAIQEKPAHLWNTLDSLCDSLHQEYGVKVIYEYTPRVIAGSTFFVPPNYEQALGYTRVVIHQLWLKPLKENFPEYFEKETPIEFILVGGFIHFNDITSTGAAAGAGLNAQFYRLGMGGVNNFNADNRNWLWNQIITLYHEHAHQQDHKYGRGYLYDRVSQGDYYGLTYFSRSTAQARIDGFFIPYGGYAPEEDFATTVETLARYNRETIEGIIQIHPNLQTKYRMIHNFYLEKGMDLHELHEVLDSVVFRTNF